MPGRDIEPGVCIILGATGDLVERKLLPALARLRARDLLPPKQVFLGVALDSDMDDDAYRDWAVEAIEAAGDDLEARDVRRWCADGFFYVPSGDDARAFERILDRARQLESERDLPGPRTVYLAVPPRVFPEAIEGFGQAGLDSEDRPGRLVIEKPFGRDLDSARDLNELLRKYFDESQIYRIDHFLGKETVQNLLILRFANVFFESMWNRTHVDNVQITVAEDIGVGDRAGYYDSAGALRDMIQNHVTQILTHIAMDAPSSYDAGTIRDEKLRLLRAVRPISREHVVLGQYTGGEIDGEPVCGYREEEGIEDDSTTESFVALQLSIDNWRWQGVPFFLRTGKRMERKVTEVVLRFRQPPVCLFESMGRCDIASNILRLRLEPDERFSLSFEIKEPGEPLKLRSFPFEFRYADAFDEIPKAYETLLLDVLTGDQTLFVRGDEAEAAWKLYTPLLEDPPAPSPYAAGTWGPESADELLRTTGRRWHDL